MAQTISMHCYNHKKLNATYFEAYCHKFWCTQCCEHGQLSIAKIEPIINNSIKLLELRYYLVSLTKHKEDVVANMEGMINLIIKMEKEMRNELNTKDKEELSIQIMKALKEEKYMNGTEKTMIMELENTAKKIKDEIKTYNKMGEKILEKGINLKYEIEKARKEKEEVKETAFIVTPMVKEENKIEIEKYQENKSIEEIVESKILPNEEKFGSKLKRLGEIKYWTKWNHKNCIRTGKEK